MYFFFKYELHNVLKAVHLSHAAEMASNLKNCTVIFYYNQKTIKKIIL